MKNRTDFNPYFLLTIDLEDWFQVENLKSHIDNSKWNKMESRFENNTIRLLDLFDQFNIKTTFFVLGWNAKKAPELIREVYSRGHEIASHGFDHHLCHELSSSELRDDLIRSKSVLEEITWHEVLGYRAPSFTISDKALKVISEVGFTYDSSYNSFSLHDRYGKINLDFSPDCAASRCHDGLWEIPVSNLSIASNAFPWSGGGYFRLLPWTLFAKGIKKILSQRGAYVFYMHPWEIDTDQPRISELKWSYKLRHYNGLKHTLNKLNEMLKEFSYCNFLTCSQYLKEISSLP